MRGYEPHLPGAAGKTVTRTHRLRSNYSQLLFQLLIFRMEGVLAAGGGGWGGGEGCKFFSFYLKSLDARFPIIKFH
jgi:hypothetical protein